MRTKSINTSFPATAQKAASSSLTYDNDPQDIDKAFETFLSNRDLRLYKLRDGSTVYNALADQIYFKEECNDQVEQECMSYWQRYITRFGPISTAANNQMLYQNIFTIASEVYKRKVIVFRIDGEVTEYSPVSANQSQDPITISQHSMNEFHSLLNKRSHGHRRVRLSNLVQRVPSDIESKIDNEIRSAFETGLVITDRLDSYNSSQDLVTIPPREEEINSFDGLKLTFEHVSSDDMSDDNSSVSSIAPSAGGLLAKVAKSNYHSPGMLRKHDPFKPTQFSRRGSVGVEMESSSSKEDFSTDFSTEVADPQYCELQG